MKKVLPALSILAMCGTVWFLPAPAVAVPKLDIKVLVGVGSTTLVPRLPEFTLPSGTVIGGRTGSSFFSWQAGLAARVRYRHVFGEIGIVYTRFRFTVSEVLAEIAELEGNPIQPGIVGNDAWMNSLDFPITVGYVPYANPYFKLFLYGGWVNKFNLKGFIETGNGRGVKFRPKDVPGFPFVIYQAGMRLGVAWDLGPVNFDVNYTIGMNSITKTDFRTNSHVTQFNLGWLF